MLSACETAVMVTVLPVIGMFAGRNLPHWEAPMRPSFTQTVFWPPQEKGWPHNAAHAYMGNIKILSRPKIRSPIRKIFRHRRVAVSRGPCFKMQRRYAKSARSEALADHVVCASP